jgi:hypothetical protein
VVVVVVVVAQHRQQVMSTVGRGSVCHSLCNSIDMHCREAQQDELPKKGLGSLSPDDRLTPCDSSARGAFTQRVALVVAIPP